MFKKTTRTKNIRRKIETSDDESAETTAVESIVKKTVTSGAEKKKKNVKKSLGLSFDQEEEGDGDETFQVKKSNASMRLKANRKLKIPTNELPERTENVDMSTSATTYSSETLEALKASTPRMPASLKQDDDTLLAEKFSNSIGGLGSLGIPDAHTIHAAKKKRDLLRKNLKVIDQEDDFISLDDKSEHSRLVREEDEIGDDGEAEYEQYVGERLTLNKSAAQKLEKERRQGVRELIEEAQDEFDEESEDMERWENDLIKHGGVKAGPKQTERDPYAPPPNYKPAIIPEQATLPSLTDVLQKLELASNDLTHRMQQYEAQYTQSQSKIDELKISQAAVGKEIERGSKRYDYFQELTTYVNDLGELLDVKFPLLEELEREAHDIISARHGIAVKPQSGSDDERMGEANHTDGNERSTSLDMSTPWEEQLDAIRTQKLHELFSDVSDEYKDIQVVKEKFEAWKIMYNDDYKKAYGSLSLPGAFEFYVRCELVAWDPFLEPIEFETMHWHTVLVQYGVTEDHGDIDGELLNKVVEKVMVKKIKSMVDTLNPTSEREMQNARQLLQQVSYYIDTNERAYQDLEAAIEDRSQNRF
ncbi:hypothetical protein EC973_008655 [Apophysomyces ossiformis]|uniref:GCF C-terminal domain-containing protein n=1 Tax=Apophysomyces ossiformis TaxID=679940 RepID=A0A8H7EPM2_9FUNG|nr:hypothetical protein EC973_008655 [Apophysomyces ossiformis]